MNNLTSIDTTMPCEAADNPVWDRLAKRGHINVGSDDVPARIYYELFGTGSERVVFLNGMGSDRQMWEPNIAEFLKLQTYQVLVFDYPGTGFSDAGSGPSAYTTTAFAACLRSLLKALGWPKANVVGVSMGGMVALEFACNYPEMVNTLTLGVTNAGLAVPPLKGIIDTLSANFTSDPSKRFASICKSIYTEEYLASPAPEGSGCTTMLDFCTRNAIRKSKYSRPMSFASFVGQIGTVFRHYVSPARLGDLGKTFPDKQILIMTGDE
ncbi:alpha/beta-hydrolase, partial [Martensiomyces pterosporus]